MSQSKLISVLKQVVAEEVRKVIKEELSEILQEGLQSTINEMKTDVISNKQMANPVISKPTKPKRKINFKENKFSSILNDTDSLREETPLTMNSYAELMTEDITMTSADAMNFGAARKMGMQSNMAAPAVMQDPETGKNMQVDPAVAKAITRDYSALMKAIDKKKGR
jgi:hypothetical protein